MIKRALLFLVLLSGAIAAIGVYRTLTPPADLYGATGVFAACPQRPSCVSSAAIGERHAISPLTYTGGAATAQARLTAVITGMPGARVERAEGGYIHAVFQTPLMRFRDDVELLLRPDGRIDVRSVSRFGYRDFGVNRARVEDLRQRFVDG
jgi:uncharacterized protein (DUF1499 family)